MISNAKWIVLTFVLPVLIAVVYLCWSDKEQVDYGIEFTSMEIFRQYDRDQNGYLSPKEFEPLAAILQNYSRGLPVHLHSLNYIQDGENPDDELITLHCNFKPLDLRSVTKKIETSENSNGQIKGLLSWKTPWYKSFGFSSSQFKLFLPKEDLKPGQPWTIIKPILNDLRGQLSSYRYYPTPLHQEEKVLSNILGMFHSQVFIYSRFSPQGTVATIRAVNREFLDIAFRVHAEFQLNTLPLHPFWFTPAQFKGRIVLSRDSRKIESFRLYVPTKRKLNADMEWFNGPLNESTDEMENMEVDIGYVPQMEILYGNHKPNIKWDEEISEDEAYDIVDKVFYPFKEVPYLHIEDAFKTAATQNKLVHTIMLWGALDDQSC